jgi:hypothetical protein
MNISSLNDKHFNLHRLKILISGALTAGGCFFIITRVLRDYGQFKTALASYSALSIAGCSALFFAVIIFEAGLWHGFLKEIAGTNITMSFTQSLRIFSLSNLAKYIPGKVWPYFLQSAILSQRNIPIKAATQLNITLSIYGALSALLVCCACMLGLPLGPRLKAGACLVGGIIILLPWILLRLLPAQWAIFVVKEKAHYGIKIFAFSLAWILHGCGGILAAHSQFAGAWEQSLQIIAGMTLSWLVGVLAFFSPAGLGVRETALYLALTRMPEGLRLSLPLVTRVCLLLAEGMVLITALVLSEISKNRPKS